MLLRFTVLARDIMVMEKVAFSRGSSQQGKALLAEVDYVEVLRGLRGGKETTGVTSN